MERFKLLLVLSVICNVEVLALTTEQKAKFTAGVVLTENGDVYNFFSSGFPPHAIDDSINPNEASVQNFTYNITINPVNSGDTIYCTSLGPVGFATNGVAIYNALTGQTTDAVRYEEFDDCKGHSSPGGSYHYHQFPVCVGDLTTEDEFIGIALDGNPIYGPKASDKTALLTSADLDACHGRFVNGEYRYHITADFPYVIGCYKAEPATTAQNGGPPGGDGGPPRPGGDGGPPPGGNGGQPPGRRKRQTETMTCTNSKNGGELCDCTSGTLTECDTLTGDDVCDDNDNDGSDDGSDDHNDDEGGNDNDNIVDDDDDDDDPNSATSVAVTKLCIAIILFLHVW